MPDKHSVTILHKTLGKINCVYSKHHRAARLCTGSFILCLVEKYHSWYKIVEFDLVAMPIKSSLEDLTFFHQIVMLCMKMLPKNVVVNELFDYLYYVYQKSDTLTPDGKKIVLLRLFLLFDLLPEDKKVYYCALQDPYQKSNVLDQHILLHLEQAWERFYQE